jgi:hypothetical protein
MIARVEMISAFLLVGFDADAPRKVEIVSVFSFMKSTKKREARWSVKEARAGQRPAASLV